MTSLMNFKIVVLSSPGGSSKKINRLLSLAKAEISLIPRVGVLTWRRILLGSPSQLYSPVVFWTFRSFSQWRDRTGFSPVSLFPVEDCYSIVYWYES